MLQCDNRFYLCDPTESFLVKEAPSPSLPSSVLNLRLIAAISMSTPADEVYEEKKDIKE